MKKYIILTTILVFVIQISKSQNIIPLDTIHWKVTGNNASFLLERYKGKDAVYIKRGAIQLKDRKFLNGTIEYDIFLKEEQAFPGLVFRNGGKGDFEQFYLRPHLSGKPDANQAAAGTKGITPWQLYFGPRYSFPYHYKYNDWTHVKVVVNGNRAQVYLDHSEKPNLSWNLFHTSIEGTVSLSGGNASGMHLANIIVDKNASEIVDFKPIKRKAIEGLVGEWEVSDKFEEKSLNDPAKLRRIINARKWGKKIKVEEGTAANISRVQLLRNGQAGETVFAKITIISSKNQMKLFHFGYSDRVVAILNGKPIYKGNNRWRSRDYRYLGTVGLFDAVYLNLKKGNNTLLMAVSEDFGGWLITGKFEDLRGIKIK